MKRFGLLIFTLFVVHGPAAAADEGMPDAQKVRYCAITPYKLITTAKEASRSSYLPKTGVMARGSPMSSSNVFTQIRKFPARKRQKNSVGRNAMK